MTAGDRWRGWYWCTAGHRHWGTLGAAGLLVAAADQVLLQLRAAWSEQGGTWGLPGGARHDGETAAAAALRETARETGLSPAAVQLTGTELVEPCDARWSYVTVVGHLAEPVPVRHTPEGAVFWVPLDNVEGLRLHPGLAVAWPHLRRLLDQE